jgi:multidrug efflux pump subunit AcrA (membrane-fusion protein)
MASRRRPLYRKAALDKLSSPEELDRLMQITRPGAWLVLAGFGGVLLMIVLWSIFGSITTPLKQSGTLTLSNPVTFVTAPVEGQVVEISKAPGDLVAADLPLARISTSEGTVAVVSPANGRVLSLRVKIGDPVDAGSPLFSIETFAGGEHEREVVAYVSLDDQQRINPGMSVQILPSTVEREKYGYLKGKVAAVAQFEATRDEMIAILGDESFVDNIADAGPLFEVRINIKTRDDGSYVWSASDGPDAELVIGTPCQITITIDNERPISKIFNLSS